MRTGQTGSDGWPRRRRSACRTSAVAAIAGILMVGACGRAPVDVAASVTQISGRVVDAATGAPLSGASIATTPTTSTVAAASDGGFVLRSLVAGAYQVRASRDGYEPAAASVSVREGETAVADLRLRQVGPDLALTPSSLDLGPSLSQASVRVQNRTGVGVVAWRANSDQPWLSVSPAAGSLATIPTDVTVAVDHAKAPFGVSVGRVTLTSDAGTRTLDVRIERVDPDAPRLAVGIAALEFGDTTRALPLDLTNAGSGTLTWRASASAPWLSVGPGSGTGPARLAIAVERAGLPDGSYSATASILSNGGTVAVEVMMTVAGAASPAAGSWAVVATFPGMRPTGVSAPGPSDVWVGGAIRGTDGAGLRRWDGTQWSDETAVVGPATSMAAITSIDMRGTLGFVVGPNVDSRLVVARRAGAGFELETLGGTAASPHASAPVVALADATDGTAWVGGYAGLLHRYETGRWSTLSLGNEPFIGLAFASPASGWALTPTRLYRFDGVGWSVAPTPAMTSLRAIAYAGGALALAGATGTYLRPSATAEWLELRDAQGRAVPARSVYLAGATSGWVIANAGLMRLSGSTLGVEQLPTPSTLVSVVVDGAGGVWAVGYTGDYANGYSTIVYRRR